MTGRLDRVWVECATARDTWGTKRTTKIIHIILLFDPTWGTNCYDMKLSMLVTISREDESKILSYMLHHEESYTDVYWVIHRGGRGARSEGGREVGGRGSCEEGNKL